MKDILTQLSSDELNLLEEVKNTCGSMEEIVEQLKQNAVFTKYDSIYSAYNGYYKQIQDLEAFKRIIFIQWYQVSEPAAFTGIHELDQNIERANLDILKTLIDQDQLDAEFKCMISHYYTISAWYFNSFFDFSNCVNSTEKLSLKSSWEDRGQMGIYWNSISLYKFDNL